MRACPSSSSVRHTRAGGGASMVATIEALPAAVHPLICIRCQTKEMQPHREDTFEQGSGHEWRWLSGRGVPAHTDRTPSGFPDN